MKSYEDWQCWIRCALNDAFMIPNRAQNAMRFGHASMMTKQEKLTARHTDQEAAASYLNFGNAFIIITGFPSYIQDYY